ncbi:MAG: phage baseplate assembly protein V [Myxococcota bacterium]
MTMQYNSLYAGIVADNKDPKRLGRVKARVGILGDAFTSHWLLPAGAVAGPNCGGFYPPPPGAGVVVLFAEGDPENGWYIGGFWAEPGKVNEVPKAFQRVPPTNQGYQSPKGHLLEFDDLPASAGVRLTSKGKHAFVLDDAKKRVVLSSSGNAKITLEPQGGLLAKSSGNATVTLDPQGGLLAKSSGNARVQLDPQGGLLAQSSGNAKITLDPRGTATVQSAAGVKAVLDKGVTLSAPNGAKATISAKGDIQLKDPSGTTAVTIQAGKVTVTAAATVKLKAPAVSVDAAKVSVGTAAALHPALAENLATLFNTHTHGTPVGPTTPPVVPMVPAAIGSATVTVAK